VWSIPSLSCRVADLRPIERRAAGGFTLLEMLVVLVLVGLVATLLAQALWQSFDLVQRAREQTADVGRAQMRVEWFRSLAQGLQADNADGPAVFQGQARRFAGLTTAPPAEEDGVVRAVTVELDYARADDQTMLVARARGGPAVTLMQWEGNSGAFEYLDADGRRFESWPPPFGRALPQLPRAIVLRGGSSAAPVTIYGVVAGERQKVFDLQRATERGGGNVPQ
jgi:general secretion pathway protein J